MTNPASLAIVQREISQLVDPKLLREVAKSLIENSTWWLTAKGGPAPWRTVKDERLEYGPDGLQVKFPDYRFLVGKAIAEGAALLEQLARRYASEGSAAGPDEFITSAKSELWVNCA